MIRYESVRNDIISKKVMIHVGRCRRRYFAIKRVLNLHPISQSRSGNASLVLSVPSTLEFHSPSNPESNFSASSEIHSHLRSSQNFGGNGL